MYSKIKKLLPANSQSKFAEMEWDIVFTISECKWGTFLFILFFITCVYEIGKRLSAYFISSMKKINFEFFLFAGS